MFNKSHQKIYQRLVRAEFPIKATNQTYRTINHWDEKGVLSDRRIQKNGWRKFNWFELVWIRIVGNLRDFGIPIASLCNCKEFLFSLSEQTLSEKEESKLNKLELLVLRSLLLDEQLYLRLDQSGSFTIIDQATLSLKSAALILPIKQIVTEVVAEEELSLAENVRTEAISEDQKSIIEAIKTEQFKRIMLTLDKGAPITILKSATKSDKELTVGRILEGSYRRALLFRPDGKLITSELEK